MSDINRVITIDEVFAENKYVILDTETTGIRAPFQIVQIAIIEASDGKVVLNEYVRATQLIPQIATAIHGITDAMIANAPTWSALRLSVLDAIRGRDCVTYNATFDRQALHESDRAAGLAEFDYHADTRWWDAMTWYADFWQEWDSYHGNNRWQRLSAAMAQQRLKVPNNAHDALADARMAHALIRAVLDKKVGKNA